MSRGDDMGTTTVEHHQARCLFSAERNPRISPDATEHAVGMGSCGLQRRNPIYDLLVLNTSNDLYRPSAAAANLNVDPNADRLNTRLSR